MAGASPDLKRGRRRKVDTTRIDRLPPHSHEAEQGVLGCCLLSPKDGIGRCIEKIKNSGVFYDLRHQMIYENLVAMFELNQGIDMITLQQWMKDAGELDQVGGIAYLNALQDSVPSAANLDFYLDILIDKNSIRKVIRTCTEVVGKAYDHQGEVDELLDDAERCILNLRNETDSAEIPTARTLVQKALGAIEKIHGRGGAISGMTTGFTDFDEMTDGLHGGEMIVIAARPSMGKTSICMNIAEHVALVRKEPVGVFSLEMTDEQLMTRLVCCNARVSMRHLKQGFLAESDFPKMTNSAGRLANAPLFIDDTSGLSILQLRARARRMWQMYGIKLLVIDYLQLLHSTSRKAQDNRNIEIADISGGIKGLAKDLGIPVLVASQLNRDMEKEKGRKPRLSDLRESGAIEQDADVVGLLYKPKVEDEEAEGCDGEAVNLLIAKQRNGPTGDVHLTFLKSFTRFESAAKVSDEDVPTDDNSSRTPHAD